jgi:hypothetical protein
MDLTEARKDTRFQPGRSGSPAGKEPGARNRAPLLTNRMVDGSEAAA